MTRRIVSAVTAAVVMAAAPLTVQGGEVQKNAAECQSGTCCSQTGSTCVIGSVVIWHHKFASGSCSGGGTGEGPDYKDIPW